MILDHFWRKRWLKIHHLPRLALAGFRYRMEYFFGRPKADTLKQIYLFLAGHRVSELEDELQNLFEAAIKSRLLDLAREEIEKHRLAGRKIVLISTALSSLADIIGLTLGVDQVIASRLEEKNGRLTGRLATTVFGTEKLIKAREISPDLSQDWFYSDCFSDEPLLLAVGFPRVVNPDRRLKKIAQKRKWLIHYWN